MRLVRVMVRVAAGLVEVDDAEVEFFGGEDDGVGWCCGCGEGGGLGGGVVGLGGEGAGAGECR